MDLGTHHKFKTVNSDYGQDWFNTEAKSFHELGENELKLKYLEKSLKSMRRLEKRKENATEEVDEELNEKLKYDKNAVIAKKFPFKAEEFKYPNEDKNEPNSLYITYNDEYGNKKPNQLELPGNKKVIIFSFKISKFFFYFIQCYILEKFYPINNSFTKDFNFNMYKNNSLNTKVTRSKAHKNLDTIIQMNIYIIY